MHREIIINFILEKLASLITYVRLKSSCNLHDANIHSENFFASFFNKLFDKNFRNANVLGSNFGGIDLIDDDNKIVAQVTSETTRKKIVSTLEKDTLKSYPGYTLIFIFLKEDCKNLKDRSYPESENIIFDPKANIWDFKKISNEINNIIDITKLISLKTIIEEELTLNDSDFFNTPTNLATLLNLLADSIDDTIPDNFNLDSYSIDKKIEYNSLELLKDSIFEESIPYISLMEKLYQELSYEKSIKASSILLKLNKFYINELKNNPDCDNITLFFNITNAVISFIQSSPNYTPINLEELEYCVNIIVVDAFIKCKIFKKPKGDYYVTSN